MKRPRVAFVVQRAGIEVNGGAEYLCLAVARRMAAVWDLDIITTRARDYVTWEDYYPEGVEVMDGVTIRRFGVDETRSTTIFDRLSQRLLPRLQDSSLGEQEEWMRAQGPYSTSLLRYIEDYREKYDVFIFFTYLYATTYFGLPLVADKAVLVPFAHDEWPIHAPFWQEFFSRPSCFVFSTPEERGFLRQRFPAANLEGPTIGIGIDMPTDVRPDRFRRRYGIDNPYALYLGRIDPSKGCERLIDAFIRYKQLHQDDLILVLVGRAAMPIPVLPFVRAVGFVDEETKMDALAAAEVVVMPSALESLSIVLLESWSVRRPVLVSGASDVLVGQTMRADGGLWYDDDAEFVAALHMLRGDLGRELGESGFAFVDREYRWERIIELYRNVVENLMYSNSKQATAKPT
jgi:glycosyltransferase involved in cell wall biosynthesis